MDTDGISSAPPASRWSKVWYDKIVSCGAGGSARMAEEVQCCQRSGGARRNTFGIPAVAEQTKPGDSLQVQVEPVVPIL